MTPEALISHALLGLEQYQLKPVLGLEVECYVALADAEVETLNHFWQAVVDEAAAKQGRLLRIEKEKGHQQYEMVFDTFTDAFALVDAVEHMRVFVCARAVDLGVEASFAPKPFVDAPGSGMHLHVNLVETNGDNAFLKTDEYISPVLHHSLGGLCAISAHVMPIFCPQAEGFARFMDADHMARNVSWGSNNRSCAVRIPYSPIPDDKRLEWRLPAADARVSEVVALALFALYVGIDQRLEPPEQYHGLAARDASLVPLPLTMEEARERMAMLPESFLPLTGEMLAEWCELRLAA